ncbi:MAG: sigma 54-interacting transcriptional regulator [Candidatus Binatia bacterium]
MRCLEEKEILAVGSTTPRKIDVRIIAATNRNLLKETEEGRFREDLYCRLNVLEIHIPPLRKRPEDIPLLVEHLIQKHNPELKRHFKGAEADVIRLFMSQPWKGNVRELDNVIEHTMILAEGEWIKLKDHHCPSQEGRVRYRLTLMSSRRRLSNSKSSISGGF